MRRVLLSVAAAATLVYPVSAQYPRPQVPPQPPAAQAPAGPNTWTVDTNHTAAGFSVKHMMVSTVRGILGPVKGTIDYDGKSIESLKADITIDVSGVNTGNEGRDKDLKSENFFEIAKYPTATFKSKRVESAGQGKFRLIGDLTIHGVTKEVALNVEGPSPILKQPNGAQRIGAGATTTLNRKDFGMQWNRMVEAAPVVGDEVQVTIDIEANKR
jgi:polyisoprenoid-binding protein YceI